MNAARKMYVVQIKSNVVLKDGKTDAALSYPVFVIAPDEQAVRRILDEEDIEAVTHTPITLVHASLLSAWIAEHDSAPKFSYFNAVPLGAHEDRPMIEWMRQIVRESDEFAAHPALELEEVTA